MPEQLVESMLFGHSKGAFTGADANKEGLFKAADKGTLFLDEMPINIQPKLLHSMASQAAILVALPQRKLRALIRRCKTPKSWPRSTESPLVLRWLNLTARSS